MNMTMNHDDTNFILALALASNQTHKDIYIHQRYGGEGRSINSSLSIRMDVRQYT